MRYSKSYHHITFRPVLLHWFDGSKKQLQKAMDLDCYVSFGPVTGLFKRQTSITVKSKQGQNPSRN